MQNFLTEQKLRGDGVSVQKQDGSFSFLSFLKGSLQIQLSQELLKHSYLQTMMEFNDKSPERKETQPEAREENTDQTEKLLTRNETKNIPKNFGKAIISFIQGNQKLVNKLLISQNITYEQYVPQLKSRKKYINSIADLRGLWMQEEFRYAKVTRILSQYFLKRASLKYIFKSRISNFKGHVKYRNRLTDVIKNPQEFTSMKVFYQ